MLPDPEPSALAIIQAQEKDQEAGGGSGVFHTAPACVFSSPHVSLVPWAILSYVHLPPQHP